MKTQLLILSITGVLIACNNQPPDNKLHANHSSSLDHRNYSDSVNTGLIQEDTMKSSPHLTSMATVNGTHVHLEYGSPGVKNRIIWGGLVGYDKVWVTGAHTATTVQFSKPVNIDGKEIPKGTYALFTIPGKEKWIIIINSRYEQHLADDYDQKEDLARVTIDPVSVPFTPRLIYQVSSTGKTSGEISMQWEKLRIALPFNTINE